MLANLRPGGSCTICLCYGVRTARRRGDPDCLGKAQGQQVLQVVATLRPLVAMASGRPSYAGRLILPRAPGVSSITFQVTTC